MANKFIEVTVDKFEFNTSSPHYKEYADAFGISAVDYEATGHSYISIFNVSDIDSVFIEDGCEDHKTTLGFKDCVVYIQEGYEDIAERLGLRKNG